MGQNRKQRFTISNSRIRANYGQSIPVGKSMYENRKPIKNQELLKYLFQGTNETATCSILQNGLDQRNRQFVHLSYIKDWARKVGSRHSGQTRISSISTQCCLDHNAKFYHAGLTTIGKQHTS